MATHDYHINNQSGADFRADLNNALSAIATVNSGATEPSTTFAHQLWVDTSSNVLKIRNAANNEYKGILSVCDLPLVSTDFNHNPSSSIFDSNHLYQIGNQTKILAWYDNEWGFSKRMIELSLYIKEISAISLKETA